MYSRGVGVHHTRSRKSLQAFLEPLPESGSRGTGQLFRRPSPTICVKTRRSSKDKVQDREFHRQAIINGLYMSACLTTDEQYLSWLVIKRAIKDLGVKPGGPDQWPQRKPLPPVEEFFKKYDHAAYALQAGLNPGWINRLLEAAGLL